jgi:hypothetical protein
MRDILTIILMVIIAGFVIAYYLDKTGPSNIGGGAVACTEEAKLCPDGSAVGRTGPKCEFSPCPISTKTK